jgi:hypothetical protein
LEVEIIAISCRHPNHTPPLLMSLDSFSFFRPLRTLLRWGIVASAVVSIVSTTRATTIVPPEFEQLVNESDYVIRGVVTALNSEYKTSTKGRKIITKIEVNVLEVVTGIPPEKVVLEMVGGRIGTEELILEGAPHFKVGEESIFFVSKNGRSICPVFAMKYGLYPIEEEASSGKKFVSRGNKVPLENTAEIALPMTEEGAAVIQRRMKTPATALTPEQFVQQIKSAKNPAYRRAKNN